MDRQVSNHELPATSCNFDCSICLEVSQEPVVTMCGHLFCWSCLHQWITVHSLLEECPVCKACVKDKIIPLYGRGKTGFSRPESKTILDAVRPAPPLAHPSSSTAPRLRQDTGFQYQSFIGQESHGFFAQENFAPEGAFSTSSVTSFGLFPALFGVHMVTSSNHNGGYPSGTSYNSMSLRMPVVSSMSSQQRRWIAQQEFVLHWVLILLAGFATLCFLLF